MVRVTRFTLAAIGLAGVSLLPAVGRSEPAHSEMDLRVLKTLLARPADHAGALAHVLAFRALLAAGGGAPAPTTVAASHEDRWLAGALLDPRLPHVDTDHRAGSTVTPIVERELGHRWTLELAAQIGAVSCPNCSPPVATP